MYVSNGKYQVFVMYDGICFVLLGMLRLAKKKRFNENDTTVLFGRLNLDQVFKDTPFFSFGFLFRRLVLCLVRFS